MSSNPTTDREQREHDAARYVTTNAKEALTRAEVVYRCKRKGCRLAVVVRHNGHRFIVYQQHAVPETLTTDQDAKNWPPVPPSRQGDTRCCELPDDRAGWWPDWSMNCTHSAYHLTRAQLAADIERLRGRRSPVVVIEGNRLGGYDRDAETTADKVR